LKQVTYRKAICRGRKFSRLVAENDSRARGIGLGISLKNTLTGMKNDYVIAVL
jgi:hypothetical protein